jgi:hypothetical protein
MTQGIPNCNFNISIYCCCHIHHPPHNYVSTSFRYVCNILGDRSHLVTPIALQNITNIKGSGLIELSHWNERSGLIKYQCKYYEHQIFPCSAKYNAGPSGPSGLRCNLQPVACWDCGFESHRRNGFCCASSVFSGRALCDELITRPQESYRLWCVVQCVLETSWMMRPWPIRGCREKARYNRYTG